MKSFSSILSACNFSCLVLLAGLSIFHDSVVLNGVTLMAGRFHVLFLHLPIGGMFALICIRLLKNVTQQEQYEHFFSTVLSSVVLVSLLSAITGIFIAASGDYGEETVALHRKSGITFSVLLYAYSVIRNYLGTLAEKLLFTLLIVVLIFTGHQGGVLTHGKDFLQPHKRSVKNAVNDTGNAEDSVFFEAAVMPVIAKKCISCHNEQKAKGELMLTDADFWQRGGKSGPLIQAGDVSGSLLMQRVLLPDNDELHMPPIGKPQLTGDEIKTLRLWIQSGASYIRKVKSYMADDSMMSVISVLKARNEVKKSVYTFKRVTPDVLERLNTPYVHVTPIYAGSPALSATFFVASAYSSNALESLTEVKDQLVYLNLSGMPVGAGDLKKVSAFSNLEKLYLNNTKVTDKDVLQIKELKKLTHLSLLNTEVRSGIRKLFSATTGLSHVYLGSPGIQTDTINAWRKAFPKITFVEGIQVKETIPLSPPVFLNENGILADTDSIRLMHHIKGAAILYTMDGSEPDTTTGIRYTKPFVVKQSAAIRAKAVKEGWTTSQTSTFNAYKAGIKPKEVRMLSRPASQYPGLGTETFTNSQLAAISNTRDANWIGYRDEPCVLEVEFEKPVAVQRLVLNFACHIPQYIFPPTRIRVYGGNSLQTMQLIGSTLLKPIVPAEKEKVLSDTGQLSLSGKKCRYFRIEADNLSKIPAWHPGKGERGWLFIDEIFFYQ